MAAQAESSLIFRKLPGYDVSFLLLVVEPQQIDLKQFSMGFHQFIVIDQIIIDQNNSKAQIREYKQIIIVKQSPLILYSTSMSELNPQNESLSNNCFVFQNRQKQPQQNIAQTKKAAQRQYIDEIKYLHQQNQSQSKKQWTPEEDELVYKLHNEYGNKWAIIAEHLKGRYFNKLTFRTDNCIKNHFYSRLRKGLRKLNKIIEDEYKKAYKQFKIIDLYKVIQASDQKFKEVKTFTNEMTQIGYGTCFIDIDLKNRLFLYAEEECEQNQEYQQKVKRLLEDLTEFTKNYKRKSKKSRRYSPMGVDSVYRASNKKQNQGTQSGQHEIQQQDNQQNQQKQKQQVKQQPIVTPPILQQVKIEEEQIQKKQEKVKQIKQKKQRTKSMELERLLNNSQRKQSLIEQCEENQHASTRLQKSKHKTKDYRHFSDDQDEQKNENEYVREQRLNNFAENILKTFKSYYSFQSFKSNSVMEEPFFQ